MGEFKRIQFQGYIVSYLNKYLENKRYNKDDFNKEFYNYLLNQILNNSIKTLLTMFFVFKKENLLRGNSPEERYDYFDNYSSTKEFHNLVDRIYPLLKLRVDKILYNHVMNYDTLKMRIEKDNLEIYNKFGIKIKDIKDCKIKYGVSDFHKGSKSVCIIEVCNKRLIYKPRSGKIDLDWGSFIKWVNSKGLSLKLDTIGIIDKEEYNWQEYVDSRACKSELEIKKLYYRMGILAAISYTLKIEDLHMENIIVSGEFPYIIDLETIFQVDEFQNSNLDIKTATDILNKEISESILSTQLFPTPSKFHDSDVDVSGITGKGGQVIKDGKVKIINSFTDYMEVIREDGRTESKNNIGFLEGSLIEPKDYIKEIIEGFREGYILLKDNKKELLQLINSGKLFYDIYPRYLFRNTNLYATIIELSKNPKYLKNKIDLNRLYKLLFNTHNGKLENIYQSELEDLFNGDIPYFYGHVNGKNIYNSKGKSCFKLDRTPLMEVNNRIKNLNKKNLNIQIDFILKSMIKPKKTWNLVISKNNYKHERIKYIKNNNEFLIKSAQRIGDILINKAIIHEKTQTVNWMDVQNKFPTWSIGSQEIFLYNGLAGNAIFFSSLYFETKDIRYKDILYKILNTIKLDMNKISNASTSAFNGMISIAYLYANLYRQTEDENMLKKSIDIIDKCKEKIFQNLSYDIIDGLAGVLVVIIHIFELNQDMKLKELSIKIGKDIIKNIKIEKDRVYWRNGNNIEPMIAGFSHGLSGVSYALGKLYRITNSNDYILVANKLIEIENYYYNDDIENWIDLRIENTSNLNNSPIHWCHGASGIGLSRIKNKDLIDTSDDIDKALKVVKDQGLYLDSDCLCHGNLGNIGFLLEVYKENNDINLYNRIIARISEIIKQNEKNKGYKTGVGQEFDSPNFMLGLSGIGYKFLRINNPEKHPSILLLEV